MLRCGTLRGFQIMTLRTGCKTGAGLDLLSAYGGLTQGLVMKTLCHGYELVLVVSW
jgi:hypothetical protein